MYIEQLKKVIARLVVPAHEHCEVRRFAGPRVVFVEVAHLAVFGRHGDAVKVVGVAHGLEVAANNQEVDAWPAFDLAGLGDRGVDCVEGAVAAAFDGEAHAVFFFELDGCRHGCWICMS